MMWIGKATDSVSGFSRVCTPTMTVTASVIQDSSLPRFETECALDVDSA